MYAYLLTGKQDQEKHTLWRYNFNYFETFAILFITLLFILNVFQIDISVYRVQTQTPVSTSVLYKSYLERLKKDLQSMIIQSVSVSWKSIMKP